MFDYSGSYGGGYYGAGGAYDESAYNAIMYDPRDNLYDDYDDWYRQTLAVRRSRRAARDRAIAHDPELSRRVTVEGGTDYPHCTQSDLDALQSDRPKPEQYRAFPRVTSIEVATRALVEEQTPRTPEQHAALARVKALFSRKDLGGDIVFKAFNDFDTALSNGVLKNRVVLKWTEHAPAIIAFTYRSDSRKSGASRIFMDFNPYRLSPNSPQFWGVFLHQLAHAFMLIHATNQQTREARHSEDETSHCGYEHTGNPVFAQILEYVDRKLEGRARLLDKDAEVVELLRSRMKKRHDRANRERGWPNAPEAQPGPANPYAGDFGNDFGNDYYGHGGDAGAAGHDGRGGHGGRGDDGQWSAHSGAYGGPPNQGHGYQDHFQGNFQGGFPGGFGSGYGGEYGGAEAHGGSHGAYPSGHPQDTGTGPFVRKETDIDPYQVLGVPRNVTPDQITKAYRDLSRIHHPDRVTPEHREAATKRFQQINYAHEILSDEKRRRWYDMTGQCS